MDKLDGKFYGEIYKNKNGARVPDDQWIVFLAKDNAVPTMLNFYLKACIEIGADLSHLMAVKDLMSRVSKWRTLNLGLCRTPDTEEDELFKEQPPLLKINKNNLARDVADMENGKVEDNIAQVKDVMKALFDRLQMFSDAQIIEAVRR